MDSISIKQLESDLLQVWSERKVFAGIETQPLEIYLYQSTSSTMDAINDLSHHTPVLSTLIPAWPIVSADRGVTVALALEQTAGRGRHNRQWVSNPGSGIYLTLAFETSAPVADLPNLSLAAGLAAVNMVRAAGAPGVLKWPNDVLVQVTPNKAAAPYSAGDFKKVAGILLETAPGSPGTTLVLIGVGVNFAPDQVAGAAGGISLKETADRRIGYNEAALALIDHLIRETGEYFARFPAGSPNPEGTPESAAPSRLTARLAARWQEASMMDGVTVRVVRNGVEKVGISRGIDSTGALLVDVEGSQIKIVSGEVTIVDVASV